MPKTAANSHLDLSNERLKIQWLFGDWHSIVNSTDKLHAAERQDAASQIYRIAALYQLGLFDEAQLLAREIKLDAESKSMLAKLLISGVYNCLGKADSCVAVGSGNDIYFSKALDIMADEVTLPKIKNARKAEQLAQLGIPCLWDKHNDAAFKSDFDHLLTQLLQFEDNPYLHISLAEAAIGRNDFQTAILHWQAVAGALGVSTPQIYYDRLKFAYEKAGRYPLASDEEEILRGDRDKHELLLEIHRTLAPSFYFEIGVESGKSLSLARCKAIGVDPMPRVVHKLGLNANVVVSTSDDFFSTRYAEYLTSDIEFAFIDGMHLFEFALRDFINTEKFCNDHALIVIDDIFPGHPAQAERDRRTRAWTGDVWKLHKILKRYRPDLFIITLDVYPTGVMLISGLDRNNKILDEKYDEAVLWLKNEVVPSEYITRKDAWLGNDARVNELINALVSSKSAQLSSDKLKVTLNQLNGIIE